MQDKNIVVVTGQTGIKVKDSLKKLSSTAEIISIEDEIVKIAKLPSFPSFLERPPKIQHDCWKRAFQSIQPRLEQKDKQIYLTFHAVYSHSSIRQFVSAIEYNLLSQYSQRIKMVLTFIDDVYDIYKRLLAPGQMYSYVLKKYDDVSRKKIDDKEAVYLSIEKILRLISWREKEIMVSQAVARNVGCEHFTVSVNHPLVMVKRLIEKNLEELKIFYISHPISVFRSGEQFDQDFAHRLVILLEELIKKDDVVLFFPTSIDELRIKKDSGLFVPELGERWPEPNKKERLKMELPEEVENIKPLNPLGYRFTGSSVNKDRHAISKMLSMLWNTLYYKQIMGRDYNLVDQSKSGIIVFQPNYDGRYSSGVEGEMIHNSELIRSSGGDAGRKLLALSLSEDLRRLSIRRVFNLLRDKLDPASKTKITPVLEKQWIENKSCDIRALGHEGLRKTFEGILPNGYTLQINVTDQKRFESGSWGEGEGPKWIDENRAIGFREIYNFATTDTISKYHGDLISTGVAIYEAFENCDLNGYWKESERFLKEKLA